MSLRVWLAGSRSFAAEVYKSLMEIPTVAICAVTAPGPDDALWELAAADQKPVGDGIDDAAVRSRHIDLIVSAQNYAHISREARDCAHYGAVGYHPSLLPRHRGCSSVEWTVAMGDKIAGGTVYQIDDGQNTGPILAQQHCHVVPGWTASDLWREQLFPIGLRLLQLVVGTMAEGGDFVLQAQDERVATLEPKWKVEAMDRLEKTKVKLRA